MQTKVIVNGAYGKMGALACKTIVDHPQFQLVASLGRNDNLQQAILAHAAQIVIDLTSADCAYENSLIIINSGVHPIIGTTGLMGDEIATLQKLSAEKKLGGVIAPNFSLSALLMMRFAEQAARLLPEVEIIESHHQQKVDAPSGTAIKTAELIAGARVTKKNQLALKELVAGARGANHHDVPIHSVRLPGVLARQQVIFGNTGETLSITHDSIDRSCFMPGIILACQRVTTCQQLFYGLEKLLD